MSVYVSDHVYYSRYGLVNPFTLRVSPESIVILLKITWENNKKSHTV